MAFSNRVYFSGHKSFYKSEFLSKNDAALFASASFSDLFERSFRNNFRYDAFCKEVFAFSRMGTNRAFDCSLSRQRLYGDESAKFSRIQPRGFIPSVAASIVINRVGILVY